MSSPYFNDGAALPHAGFLSYFRQLERDNDCYESAHTTQYASPPSSDTEEKVFDEEAQYDFWDLNSTTDTDCEVPHSSTRRGHQSAFHSLYDFWSFISVVSLSSCAILLGLDLALGQYGMGMGLTDCIVGRHLVQSPIAHDVSHPQSPTYYGNIKLIRISSCTSALHHRIAKHLALRHGVLRHPDYMTTAQLRY